MILQHSVSGLQRLFSTASSPLSLHTPRGPRQPESVTEEAHTYDLLYPDSETLRQGQHHDYSLRHGDPTSIASAANSSDGRGGLDIKSPRDVRIIIAQDASNLSPQPRVMYDSHPPPPLPQSRNAFSPEGAEASRPRGASFTGGLRRQNSIQKSHTAPHSRQSSLSQTAQSVFNAPSSTLSPVSELGGLFSSSKLRSGGRPLSGDNSESIQSKLAKEERDETEALLECMFGAAGFPTVSSTKLHIRPPKPMDTENDMRPSSAREPASPVAFPKRKTPLNRSTTAADLQTLSFSTSPDDAHHQPPRSNGPSLLITRLFSVDSKDHDFAPQSSGGQIRSHHADHTAVAGLGVLSGSKDKAEQFKSPTYAVSVLLHMPLHRQQPSTPSLGRYTGYPALSPRSWSLEGPEDLRLLGTDSKGDIDYVIAHWTMLIRALSCFEVAARYEIINALAQLDIPYLALPVQETEQSTTAKKLKQPTRRTLQLSAGTLQNVPIIQKLSAVTGKRIALALRIRKVVPGQGRWGLWREEARWVGKWAGGKDQNFFLFNLLTAFLGSHTVWLNSLGPSRYRHWHTRHTNGLHGESNCLQHRTVIVSQDKMAARRLIFILSAFLPAVNFNLLADVHHQSEVSWSNMACSQSPPSGFSIYRQPSLRRVVNRRTGGSRTKLQATPHARSVGYSSPEVLASDDALAEGGQPTQEHCPRASDARSIQNLGLPIVFDSSGPRKSSTTTAAIVVPDPATGVPHFSSYSATRPLGTAADPRPGSSGSFVSLSLKRTLSRSESNEQGNASANSQSTGRWGSMISSFWSGRRDSSTEDVDPLTFSEEGLGISGILKDMPSKPSVSTLGQMVKEVDLNGSALLSAQKGIHPASAHAAPTPLPGLRNTFDYATPPKNIPERSGPDIFPLKLSIDESDGVVDVDIPPSNSHSSSFESTTSSPLALPSAASSFTRPSSLHRLNSTPAAQYSNTNAVADVAGWLRNYHQDFALQAVRPYDSLKEEIKRSMRTEPTPTIAQLTSHEANAEADGWTNVCTTLIADTSTFTVTRLCLRRKNFRSIHHQAEALLDINPHGRTEQEEITEEPLMDMDPTFIDAIEKVLAQSGRSSPVTSRATSRAASPSRHRSHTPQQSSPGLEVPRSECKKMVLGALEQVAKSVSAELENENDGAGWGRGRSHVPADSTLREGVRRWLNQVDREGS